MGLLTAEQGEDESKKAHCVHRFDRWPQGWGRGSREQLSNTIAELDDWVAKATDIRHSIVTTDHNVTAKELLKLATTRNTESEAACNFATLQQSLGDQLAKENRWRRCRRTRRSVRQCWKQRKPITLRLTKMTALVTSRAAIKSTCSHVASQRGSVSAFAKS